MIGSGPNASRPASPAQVARMTEFALCQSRVAVLDVSEGLQLVALWQFSGDATPRITANQWVDADTPAQLRALADHLEAVLVQKNLAGVAA